jgi:prepilin-type processing-associated H-X9-DG protein
MLTFNICFSATRDAPARPEKVADQAAYVNAHADFVYLGGGKAVADPGPRPGLPPLGPVAKPRIKVDEVLAYSKPSVHQNVGSCVLFGDGHVEWMNRSNLEKLLKDQKVEMQP